MNIAKNRFIIVFLLVAVYLLSPVLQGIADAQAEAAVAVTLPSGEVVQMTDAQLQSFIAQPGITFSATTPTLAAGQIAVEIPATLGGGFVVGTPSAIAAGLNATGIAIGATAATVVGVSTAAIVGAAAVAAGVIAAIAEATKGEAAVTHHH
ncbi:MAG: hypothetical protein AB1488_04405 [Nitrospirota bacterium]